MFTVEHPYYKNNQVDSQNFQSVLGQARAVTLDYGRLSNLRRIEGIGIDPKGRFDHDDIIGLDYSDGSPIVQVSVANPNALVDIKTPIDIEAFNRGFTRYYSALKDDPMLP